MAFCPGCGTPHDEGDRFCSSCGGTLAAPGPVAARPSLHLEGVGQGARISGGGALAGLILFFLPWIDVFGSARFNGFQVAFQNKPFSLVFLLIPVAVGAALWLTYQRQGGLRTLQETTSVSIASGVLCLLLQFVLYLSLHKEMGSDAGRVLTAWFWLSSAAYGAMIVGGTMDRRAG